MFSEALDIKEHAPCEGALIHMMILPVVKTTPRRQHQNPRILFVEELHEVGDTHVNISSQIEALAGIHFIQQIPERTKGYNIDLERLLKIMEH